MLKMYFPHFLTALKDIKTATLTFKQLNKTATVDFLEDAPKSVDNVSRPKVNLCSYFPVLNNETSEKAQIFFFHLSKVLKHFNISYYIQMITLTNIHSSSDVLKNVFQML